MQTKLKHHLAIATGAVSAAALPMGAEAAIVSNTTPISVSLFGFGSEWDIDGANGPDFLLFTAQNVFIYLSSSNARNGRGLVGLGDEVDDFNALPADFVVGPGLSGGYAWLGAGNLTGRTLMQNSGAGLNFVGGALGSNFIGFRFLSGSDMLYGWAEIILSTAGAGEGTVTINRWAYNDTPDGSIKVGETPGGQPVPAPATLALLAAGAFGLRRWRAQRAAA